MVHKHGQVQVVHIYFGSQTGTAESFAHELHGLASTRNILSKVIDLDDFSPQTFASHAIVLLIVANTGDGDPPDNAVKFHRWTTNPETETGVLSSLKFAVFGLGDWNYVNFNKMGEVTDKNMERLGAQRIHRRGIGDDAGDIRCDFNEWLAELWPILDSMQSTCEGSATSEQAEDFDSRKIAKFEAGATVQLRMARNLRDMPTEAVGHAADVIGRFYFDAETAYVKSVTELRQCSVPEDSSTVHVVLDVSQSTSLKSYAAAGTFEILPENDPDDVARILPLLNIQTQSGIRTCDMSDLDQYITFVAVEGTKEHVKKPFPTPCTLRRALMCYCDLHRAPSRSMLSALAPMLELDRQKRVSLLLNDDEALSIFHDQMLNWTQWEVWSALGVKSLDLGAFLWHCPRQRSRPFTVASSPLATPGEVHLCASLVSHPGAPLDAAVAALRAKNILLDDCFVPNRDKSWYGVCSQWLCRRLPCNYAVLALSRSSGFNLTKEDVPIIMIGAGAGVAPFRAFWQELQVTSARTAPRVLFFGCRHPEKDWIFRSEMNGETAKVRNTPLSDVILAFSRQGKDGSYDASGGAGCYVQDKIRERSADMKKWLAAGAIVYICGSTAMGESVLKTLGEVLDGGADQVQKLRQSKRIVQEFWGEPAKLTWSSSRKVKREHSETTQAMGLTVESERALKRPRTSKDSADILASKIKQLIMARRSILPKDYTGGVVSEELIQQLLSSSRWAPTHGKTEPWRFVVFTGEGRNQLIDATLDYYGSLDASFWTTAWNGEFKDFAAFTAHVEKQRREKWLQCSHLICICMRRQQFEEGKRLFPEHEEVAAVACAVQNMYLLATAMRIGAYWSSWFEHFTGSDAGVKLNDLCHAQGDRWLGVFCVGESNRLDSYRSSRKPLNMISQWQSSLDSSMGGYGSQELQTDDAQGASIRKCPDLDFHQVVHLIETRRSIFPKDYNGLAVPKADILQMIDVARWAPTHGRTEPWRFVIFEGEGRNKLIDATLASYSKRDSSFWSWAWKGEFKDFQAFQAHVERQRKDKWLRCSHLISICMRRQQPEPGKRHFPDHEEVAAVACAVHNMHLLATSLKVAAYWSSWFEHFTESPDGLTLHDLRADEGDRWLGVFCVGQSDRIGTYKAKRRPVEEIAKWRRQRMQSY